MRWTRPRPLSAGPLVAVGTTLACTGCDMLGALFDTRRLREIVLVVLVLVAIGFIASRAKRG